MDRRCSWGGIRENAGRKKTVVKQYAFKAPADVAEILDKVEGNRTAFIIAAIREKDQRDRLD